MNIWRMQGKPIVVGVQLDDHNASFLNVAVSLAKRIGSSLELVHSFEDTVEFSGEEQKLLEPTYIAHKKAHDRLLRMMTDLSAQHLDIHIHIERGHPAEDLMRIAREVSAGLILCGMKNHDKPRTFRGLSTALSLAFYSPIPVLILSMSAEIDFEKPINILLCDALGGSGWLPLESALHFANKLKAKALYHTHVLKVANSDIARALQSVVEPAGGKTPRTLKHSIKKKIEDELMYRFHSTSLSHDMMERHHLAVGIGDLDAETYRMIDEYDCQLIVIGREQFLCGNMLAFDRIPYRALLERKVGLLVLPEHLSQRQSTAKGSMDIYDEPTREPSSSWSPEQHG